jgi:hypothetical protein
MRSALTGASTAIAGGLEHRTPTQSTGPEPPHLPFACTE